MTEQEWLDDLAAQLPERNLEWVVGLARICSTEWTGDKPPTGEASEPGGTTAAVHDGDNSRFVGKSTEVQASPPDDGI